MPRGNEAKAARSHNRACMRGRSTANSSASSYNQIKGKKYKVNFTVGAFNPVMWKPKKGEWYPTYSVDIKIKNFKIF